MEMSDIEGNSRRVGWVTNFRRHSTRNTNETSDAHCVSSHARFPSRTNMVDRRRRYGKMSNDVGLIPDCHESVPDSFWNSNRNMELEFYGNS